MRDVVLDIVRRHVDDRFKRSGDGQILVRCPFHKSGQERKPSFSVNIEEGLFHCFTCHESGTIPTLLHKLGLSSQEIEAEIGPFRDSIKASLERRKLKRQGEYINNDPFRAHTILSEAIIDGFHACPVQLLEAGFDIKWLEYLQIGVDRRNRRITYPIRDIYGNLAGFSGGRTSPEQEPKYKVYRGKSINSYGNVIPGDYGTWFEDEYPDYEFKNHNYLWNYDKVYPRILFGKEAGTIIVVEGFKACIWLLQHGFTNTVALMGTAMSSLQRQQLLRVDANIILFLDNDIPGQTATQKIGNNLLKSKPQVWKATYEKQHDGGQPDNLDPHFLRKAITNCTPIHRRQ